MDCIELEEGEIEEGEYEDINDAECKIVLEINNARPDQELPQYATKNRKTSPRLPRRNEKKHGVSSKAKKRNNHEGKGDKEIYDMDEFELLLARHQLIQQQLQKVNATEKQNATSKKSKNKKKRKEKDNNTSDTKTEFSHKESSADGDDDDNELLEMRKVLLAQTSRTKTTTDDENSSRDFNGNNSMSIGVETKQPFIPKAQHQSEPIKQDHSNILKNKLEQNRIGDKQKTGDDNVAPKMTSRAQNAKKKSNRQAPKMEIKPSKKRRKRGGKRAKYLAYRAQQKKELEILGQQQAIAFDNYNTVPMDIDDDDDDDNNVLLSGVAPLPLIETTVLQPPPPQCDGFKPAEDQTSLSMTSSNVAWMPGYVETLEKDTSSKVPEDTANDKENDKQSIQADDQIDEKEVWALRAQALKSLACKRASKVKMSKKSKASLPTEKKETITTAVQRKTLLKDIKSTNDLSPLPSPMSIPINTTSLLATFEPPVHAPVVIQLRKGDFEDSSDDENIDQTLFKSEMRPFLPRRISVTDEELLRDLQDNINKANYKLKSHSLLVQQDQLQYRRLNSELSEKIIIFRKQGEEVKTLQARLQAALKEKAATKISYNNLHSKIKNVKWNLKEKLSLRKKVEEDVLRAKSIVSVKKLTVNEKGGKLSSKLRQHITMLADHLQITNKDLVNIEDKNQESSNEFVSATDMEVTKRQRVLQKTAASVKNMSKEDLAKLELELREKLKRYRNIQECSSASGIDSGGDDQNISIKTLPSIKSQKQFNRLKEFILLSKSSLESSESIHNSLVESLQQQTESTVQKTSIIGEGSSLLRSSERPQQHNSNNENFYSKQQHNFKYKSPLCIFRSYRLSPYFRTQSKYSITSKTFSNGINPQQILCKYDIHGTCNDDKCSYWHFKDTCDLSSNDILRDLVAYDLFVFDATSTMSMETKQKLLHSFTQQFITQYSGRMSSDEVLLLLWNQLKENRRSRKIPLHECVNFVNRYWFSNSNSSTKTSPKKENDEKISSSNENPILTGLSKPIYHLKTKKKVFSDSGELESQEVRYFSETYTAIDVMEKSLKENSKDVKIWLSLARYYLKQENKDGEPRSVEKALGVLSRSLEENRDSEELWIEYLKLFANNSTADELRELSYQAVMYAATYNVWWACLTLETKYLGKQEICTEMIKFIIESEEGNSKVKSNSLVEVLLYLCKLLEGRDKVNIALQCLLAALGIEMLNNNVEKINISTMVQHLTVFDQALLWICYFSLLCFQFVPACLFSKHEWGAGRLVNKRKIVLDWDKKSKNSDDKQIRKLFYSTLESFTDESLGAKKSMMMIYENFVSFELSLNNIQKAGDILRSLVEAEQSLVEAWVLLVLLYMKYSPMDIVVKIAEEAIHKCEHDVVIVYFYSSWLFQQGMPRLALEKLTKCIHMYFQFEPEDMENLPDILYLYKKVLGLEIPYTLSLPTYMPKSSQQLNFYYWLCYCLLLKIKELPPKLSTFNDAIEEAFEAAVHQYTSRDNTKKLWGAYIDHKFQALKKSQDTTITVKCYNEIVDLVTRCIVSIPATATVQDNPNVVWKDYSFQNNIVDKCLPFIPSQENSNFFEKLISLMPDNVTFALRICKHEIANGNEQQARVICGGLLQKFPKCLPLWRTAIEVECKCNSIKEARWMYEEATKSNPFCSLFWKEYVNFEIKFTTNVKKLDNVLATICEQASTYGIELQEYLNSLSV